MRNLSKPILINNTLQADDMLALAVDIGVNSVTVINFNSVYFYDFDEPTSKIIVELVINGRKAVDIYKYVYNNMPYPINFDDKFNKVVYNVMLLLTNYISEKVYVTTLGWSLNYNEKMVAHLITMRV